ncbi:MAG: hypothetical protein E7653_01270 [Ruminococcaceae bacterium]|nr:hypothetical protein [Oscillospiraceae bacterium]
MKTKCKISVGFLFVFLLLSLFFTRSEMFIPLIVAITVHEAGHVVMAYLCKIKMAAFKLDIFGAALSPDSLTYSYTSEMILCIGGPLFNFLTVILLYRIPSCVFADNLTQCSIALGSINLLPIQGFDGGRIFSALLSCFLTQKSVFVTTKVVSFLFVFLLWVLSIYILLRYGASLSTFIFSLSLFAKIFITNSSTGQ